MEALPNGLTQRHDVQAETLWPPHRGVTRPTRQQLESTVTLPQSRSCKLYLHSPITMGLPLHQQFEKQKLAGAIESATDLNELKAVAAQLLDLYYKQKQATDAIVSHKLA